MDRLNLPPYEFRVERRAGKLAIFDPIRKKFVVLTPEEWVRQHFINYMIEHLGFPKSRFSVETGTKYNQLQKRSDILFLDKQLQPQVLVECKAPSVKINQATFDQLSVYNRTLKAPTIIATNGLVHCACKVDFQTEKFELLKVIPHYDELIQP